MKSGAVSQAQTLAGYIDDPRKQLSALAQIAIHAIRQGQAETSDALMSRLMQTISATPDRERIEHLTTLAPLFLESGLTPVASNLIQQATASAQNLTAASDRAVAWAEIALVYAKTDQHDQAQTGIRLASEAMESGMTQEQRIQAATRLARVFKQLGSVDNATQILRKAETTSTEIQDRAARDRALRLIANAWFEIGDLKSAMTALDAMSSSDQRDADILDLIRDNAFSGNLFGLSAFAETLRSDALKARAYAYLGVATPEQEAAKTYFMEAIRISDRLKDELSKIAVQAEMARFMRRASFEQTSKSLFSRLEKKISALKTASQQDLAWLRLVEHSSRALDLTRAETYLGQVKDPQVQVTVREDLKRVGLVAGAI